MSVKEYKYLKFVRFKNLSQWHIEYYLNSSNMYSKYSLIFLNKLISPKKCLIKKEDYDGILPIVEKIVFKTGEIILRKEYKTGMNLYALKYNDLLVSNINFHQGATALNLLGDIVASTHYQPYSINEKIVNPAYLLMVLRSKYFLTLVSGKKAQGIKNESGYNFIGSFSIPVPSLKEQEKMVEEYKNKIQEAEKLEKQMATKYANINTLLFTELGVEISKDTIFKSLSTISFSSLDRWDIGYLQNSSKFSAKYKPIKFRDCIDCFMKTSEGKSLRMETFKIPSKNFHYIGMEHIEKATGQLLDIPIVKGSQIKSQTVVVPNGYFIYGKLRPYLNKYWLNNTNWDDIVCSSELFVFKIKNSINTRFFELVLGSNIVQEQIADLTSGARMPRITEDIFMNIRIPIPPIEIQNSIVSNIDSIAENIKDLKILALQKRTMALQNFETEIFE